jgi:putative flavoprotein involved in K+ transport
MHWLLETGLADDTADALPTPAARLACNPAVSGNDGGHDCNPRWLARRGAILLGRLERIGDGVAELGATLEEALAIGDAFLSNFKRRVDEYVAGARLDVADPEPEEDHEPVPALATLDLRDAGVGTILWANGYRPDHRWIEGLGTDRQGWPVHDRGVSNLPGLYFVGLHWLHKRKSALFVGVGEDAEHVVGHIAGRDGDSRRG